MANFLVEAYAPATADITAIEAQAQRAARERLTGAPAIQYLRSIFVLADETCFHLFKGPSREAVINAIERAGLAYERVSEATESRFDRRRKGEQ